MSPPTIKHPGLYTTFTGVYPKPSDEEICQFRGIKYGITQARFQQAVLNETFLTQSDATSYGPKCPQFTLPTRMEDALIAVPLHLASHAEDIFDEFNCLNLNITTPANVKIGSDLPVLLYIHGGGHHSGANSDWWCDGTSIVRQSIKLGKPIVMVTINYRLGALGWIGSSELRQELGNANGGNYGLRDMHTATEWVARYIAPFGGDPSNITIYGESAGARGVHSQVSSLLPSYFSGAILQSMTLGTPVFSDPQTIAEKTSVYNKLKEVLKLSTVKELQNAPWEDLFKAYSVSDPRHGMGEVGMIDDEFLSSSWRDRLKFASGRGEMLIGTNGWESSVCAIVFMQSPTVDPKPMAQSLIDKLHSIVSPSKVDALLKAYKISAVSPAESVVDSIYAIIDDFMFYKPAEWLSEHAKKHGIKVREYTFDQQQPFGGPFKGTASHSLDLAYLHGDPAIFAHLPNIERELAIQDEVQNSWIDFSYGQAPWDVNVVKQFGPNGNVRMLEKETFLRDLRRKSIWFVFDAFSAKEMNVIWPILLGHLGALVGTA